MVWLAAALAAGLAGQAATGTAPASATQGGQQQQTGGQQPQPSLGARDVEAEFKLPPLHDQPADALEASVEGLQVLARARALHLTAHSATEAWTAAEETYRAARATVAKPETGAPVVFRGTRASELNALLARSAHGVVVVQLPELVMDAPIRIAASDVALDLGQTRLRVGTAMPYAIRVEGAQDVRVRGGRLRGAAASGPATNDTAAPDAGWGVLVAGSHRVLVTGMELRDGVGGGVLVVASEDVTVWGNQMHGLRQAPVLLGVDTARATVAENEISGNLGSSNWQAGVVVSDRNVDFAATPANLFVADGYWVKAQPIAERLRAPHDNVVAYNRIADNGSSGIYSDGSVRNVIVGNRVERNSKEGLCLDNGSTADVVAWNVLRANGKRWGKSDHELQLDFVLPLGRLLDGTSPAKVPGVSIDNAAYNEVVFNEVDRNFGGGVKMVRTGVFNRVGMNLLTDNNEGQSERFHFFGVELGAAKADEAVPELDFEPSRGNQVFGNTIRGTHYAGVFFAEGSDTNDVFDNAIFGATAWAMESVRVQPQMTLNNLTNLRLRNVSSGLDPALLTLGAGVMDAPKPEMDAPAAPAGTRPAPERH